MDNINKRYLLLFLSIFFILADVIGLFSDTTNLKDYFEDDKVIKLIEYIKYGNDKKVNELIKDGVDINYIGIQGITPIYYFFLIKHYSGFKKCLELGATPDIDPNGIGLYRLIDFSMRYSDDRYFKLLLDYHVDLNYNVKYETPLLKSALGYEINIKYLKMLLKHGINSKYSDYWTDNPLLIAIINREYKKVILLLDYYDYFKDERKIQIYKREVTLKELFIEYLEENVQASGSQLLRDQQELVRYLKDKFNIDVYLQYPNGQ